MKARYWAPLAAICVIVGAWPLVYLLADDRIGLLQTKSAVVVSDAWWRAGFFAHITCGGVALAVGWSQFVGSWRERHPRVHRIVGTGYVLLVCVSGVAALCIAPQASTGWVAGLGFGTLAVVWLSVTLQACASIRQGDSRRHRSMMVHSYAACCAAVTLRLWLPLLLGVLRLDFAVAYPVVAWLCWVPNLLVAHAINSRARKHAREHGHGRR